ncbi:hypothetical protein [Moorella sp. E306M]|uniref:hypothetical protein n=1 Tax=Moorella sp. E306M TaxID=2572683 RepID=UPI0011433997|nr:hypothetical protein [Moorella sp. E306M]
MQDFEGYFKIILIDNNPVDVAIYEGLCSKRIISLKALIFLLKIGQYHLASDGAGFCFPFNLLNPIDQDSFFIFPLGQPVS